MAQNDAGKSIPIYLSQQMYLSRSQNVVVDLDTEKYKSTYEEK